MDPRGLFAAYSADRVMRPNGGRLRRSGASVRTTATIAGMTDATQAPIERRSGRPGSATGFERHRDNGIAVAHGEPGWSAAWRGQFSTGAEVQALLRRRAGSERDRVAEHIAPPEEWRRFPEVGGEVAISDSHDVARRGSDAAFRAVDFGMVVAFGRAAAMPA